MFRSVFTKYVTVVMLTIVAGFAIQISVISSLIGSYSDNSREMSLSRASDVVAEHITDEYGSTGYTSFSQYVNGYSDSISATVRLLLSYANEISIVVTDSSGKVVLAIGDDVVSVTSAADPAYVVREDIMESLDSSGEGVIRPSSGGEGSDSGVFEKARYVCGTKVFRKGEFVGAVFACTSSSSWDSLLESLVSTSILASLWVMLGSLIAVYFISERVTRPIKNMSIAAKRFAAGDFDARVTVTGNDEVAELAVAFNNMAQTLSRNEEMRRTFLGNVSHDMRTPMTTISGFVDGILDGTIPPEQHEHYLGIVSAETKRLSRLVNSLLDITRIESGERKFTMTRFNICEMARRILISMEKRIDDARLNVEFNCDSDDMYVRSDHDAVYQALYNICDNAVKFSREGGRLRIGITQRTKKVRVSVYNEGKGISAEDQPFVFDRFYKSDKSRGLDKSGVGLGLYITKTVIDALGGDVTVQSEPGKYCEFTIILDAYTGKGDNS